MILYKNRLVFGMIRRIIKTVFSVAYKVIKAFNLHFTLFVLLLGIVLAVLGVIAKEGAGLYVYLVVLALTVVYAVVKNIKNVFGIKPQKGKIKIVKVDDKTFQETQPQEQQSNLQQFHEQLVQSYVETPKYYAVKNNPNYVYAEYSDRYELFLKTSNGLKKVRVDYK